MPHVKFLNFVTVILLSISEAFAQQDDGKNPVVASANWHPAPSAHLSFPASPTLPPADTNGKISLDGAGWRLQNTIFLTTPQDDAISISSSSYPASGWLPATVPGTVLANYLADGLIPDPNFGANQQLISESFFQNDFWYRKEFIAPPGGSHQHWFLDFDGINWKADIYLNGNQVGHIDGAFFRGRFEVTEKLFPGKVNVLAVLIHRCANPGPTNIKSMKQSSHNGGILGKDSPTFVASLGWNWMPSVRGRNIGIWDHVYLEQTGPVTLDDPYVHSTVANDLHHADLAVQVTLRNVENNPVEGSLQGTLAGVSFTQKIQLAANENKTLILDPSSCPQLRLTDPPLWWPNGYGSQPLQQLKLIFSPEAGPITQKEVTFGIRELSYDTSNKILKILCNGQRIQLNGGNWGMDETMLRYGAKDYDTAIRLHKEMHLTMIRNWVGQVGKEEFFDACDKYGLLVWNDFWLANPSDGPNPDDHAMFMANVKDRILRIRNHPSLALYCGRNEGNPPKDLDEQMADMTSTLDGTRDYIPNSASGLVSGHGPYEPKSDAWYFQNRGKTLHSELGIVCVPTADTMRLMMPEKDLWPISDMWYLHDFFQSRARIYTKRIEQSYGPSANLDQFCEKAQMENWENAKAMMECWRSNRGSGGLIWMSHPAWPSLICQLYDYYLNPTAAYFGVQKACEPLHILWNSAVNQVQVANDSLQDYSHLTADASIFDLDGNLKFRQSTTLDAKSGTISVCFPLDFSRSTTAVQFIKLKLSNGDKVLSDNFYWHGTQENYTTLTSMPRVQLTGHVESPTPSSLDVTVTNPSPTIALMVCLKVVKDDAAQDRVLPVYYQDNYFSLLPNETKSISIEFSEESLGANKPKVMVQGWNVDSKSL
jgi:hypothetical protein